MRHIFRSSATLIHLPEMSSDSDTKLIPVPNNRKFVNQMKEGTVKLGVDLNLSCPNVAEMTATLGYDFCMVDFQHSAFNREKLCSMYQAIKLGGAKSITRVEGPQDRYGIQQAFDLGCDGILVPFIRTAQDVRDAVSAAKYPGQDGQEGSRSLYMNLRSHFTAGAGAAGLMAVHHEANANAIVAVQIETKDSIDNLEDILQVNHSPRDSWYIPYCLNRPELFGVLLFHYFAFSPSSVHVRPAMVINNSPTPIGCTPPPPPHPQPTPLLVVPTLARFLDWTSPSSALVI